MHLLQHDAPTMASIAVWCLFALYWEHEAKNSAPAVSSESRGARRVHLVLLVAAQLLLFLDVYGLRLRLLPAMVLVYTAGFGVEAAGILLAVWARRCLGRNWSGKITIKVDHQLVRNGPYAKVRHPIYTALLCIYAGVAIVSGELHALIGLALAVLAYLRKVRLEEANLGRAFGAEYGAYRDGTWALLPGVF